MQCTCCILNIWLGINSRNHCYSADSAACKLHDVVLSDSADCDDRNADCAADFSQRLDADGIGIILGSGREYRTYPKIICPCLLGKQCLFYRLCRNTQNAVWTDLFAVLP